MPDLLEVTGQPNRVWDRFREHARIAEAAEQISARRYGSEVTELASGGFDYDIRVTRVEPSEGPTVIAVIARS
jgi:hypothetical protein